MGYKGYTGHLRSLHAKTGIVPSSLPSLERIQEDHTEAVNKPGKKYREVGQVSVCADGCKDPSSGEISTKRYGKRKNVPIVSRQMDSKNVVKDSNK